MGPLRVIGSWWFTVAACAIAAVLYAVCAQGETPFDRWSHLLLHTAWGLALYAALVINLIAVSVRIALDRLNPASGEIARMDEHVEASAGELGVEALSAWLGRHGYHVTARGQVIIGIRGRYSFIPGLMLRLGLVVMMVAIAASSYVRRSEEMILHAPEQARIMDRVVSVNTIRATMPENFLQVGERTIFELGDLAVELQVGGRSATVTSGYATEVDGVYLRVTDFGYAVPVMIDGSQAGRDLLVLPPGKTERLKAPSGAEASIVIEPSKTMTKGLLTGKAYNLMAPRFRVRLDSADGVVLAPGEGADRVALGPSSGYFVRLRAVSDPALVWVYAGGALLLAAMVMMLARVVWYERRITVSIEGGRVRIGQSAELHNNWWVDRFRAMIEELGIRPSAREDETDSSE